MSGRAYWASQDKVLNSPDTNVAMSTNKIDALRQAIFQIGIKDDGVKGSLISPVNNEKILETL